MKGNDESVKWQCHDVAKECEITCLWMGSMVREFINYLIVDLPEAFLCEGLEFLTASCQDMREDHLWQHSSPSDLKVRLKTIAQIFGSSSDASARKSQCLNHKCNL